MDQAAAMLKATLSLLLLVAGLWKIFQVSKWLANRGDGDKTRRGGTRTRGGLDRNAPINPR